MADRLEENKTLARRFFTLLSEEKLDEAVGLFGGEGTWWIAGQDGPGSERTMPEIAETFRNALSTRAKGVQFKERSIVAEGDRVVVEIIATGTISNGNAYDQRYCFILDIKDGEIVGGHEYMDTAHSARAFAGAAR